MVATEEGSFDFLLAILKDLRADIDQPGPKKICRAGLKCVCIFYFTLEHCNIYVKTKKNAEGPLCPVFKRMVVVNFHIIACSFSKHGGKVDKKKV